MPTFADVTHGTLIDAPSLQPFFVIIVDVYDYPSLLIMENHSITAIDFQSSRFLESFGSGAPSEAPTSSQTISSSNDTLVIRETLRVYGSLYLVFFLTFCYARKRFPKQYNLRSWVPGMECELAKTSDYPGWFSWVFRVMRVNDNQLLQTIGMDGLCFIRCLRLGAKLSFGGVVNSVWLIPLFLTAESESAAVQVTDKFAKISVANLSSGSPRMAGVVIAAYIILFYTLHLITKELDWYAEFRHKYLSQRIPRNYTIYVSGIPEELRSDFALADYFRSWSSESAIVEAHMTMDTPTLDIDVAKREQLIDKLEHAMAKEHILGVTLQHSKVSFKNVFSRGLVTEKVDSVAAYKMELNKLNHKISIAIGSIMNKNDRMRQFMSRQPASSSGKVLSVPDLSPISEQEEIVFLKPEKLLDQEEHAYTTRDGNEVDGSDDKDQQELQTPPISTQPRLNRDDTPPHAFLQLIGMQDFYDDGAASHQLSDADSPNIFTSLETALMNKSNDLEQGPDSATGMTVSSSTSQLDSRQCSDVGQIVMSSDQSLKSNKYTGRSAEMSKRTISDKVIHTAAYNVSSGVKKMTDLSLGGVKQVKKATEVGVYHAAKAADLGLAGAKKAAEIGASTFQYAPELAAKLKESAAFIAPALAGQEDGAPKSAGFVVFRSIFTCQAARQMLQHPAGEKWCPGLFLIIFSSKCSHCHLRLRSQCDGCGASSPSR